MPVMDEVHAPSATAVLGPLTYSLDPYYPVLYPQGGGNTPDPGSGGSGDGNDYLQALCDASVQIGQAVVASATSDAGTILQPADASSPQPIIGIVVAKLAPGQATVQTDGTVKHGLSGLIPGSNYFVGAAGAIQAPPLTGIVYAQLVGQAQSETSLYLANSGQVYKRQVSDDAPSQD